MATVSALSSVPLHEQDQSLARLTLTHLLNPKLWDLPEWNGPQ